ncbi:MAG: hypothetical protein DRI83_12590 [Bacteroidetes bacterium]|nr:MAG: hypothetical protein DRI83_12590 [Bacteroidota bacterium]
MKTNIFLAFLFIVLALLFVGLFVFSEQRRTECDQMICINGDVVYYMDDGISVEITDDVFVEKIKAILEGAK